MTARMNGSIGAPSCCAMLIAIGVPITAAALLETTLVSTVINSIRPLSTNGVDSPSVRATKTCAMYSAPPVTSNADPSERLATIIMMIGMFRALPTSLHLSAPVANIKPTPPNALMDIGSRFVAAKNTTPIIITNARLARSVCGRSVVPSSTIIDPLARRSAIASREPCTSNTSPAPNRVASRSPTISADGCARCMANGTSP